MGGLIKEGIFLGIQNNLKIRSSARVSKLSSSSVNIVQTIQHGIFWVSSFGLGIFFGSIGSLIFDSSQSSLLITWNAEYLGCNDSHLYSLPFGQAEGSIYFNSQKSFQLAPKAFWRAELNSQFFCQ